MDHLKITPKKLSVDEITDLVSSPKCGAISLFLGTTRDNFDGKQVVKLEYEAYESMALKVMKEVCDEMRNAWSGIENIAIYHRLGVVPVQETGVVIAVSSRHRADAMAATKHCIEQLKTRVPIWKKEVYGDNTAPQWKENTECSWSNNIKQEPLDVTDYIKQESVDVTENVDDFSVQVQSGSTSTDFSTNKRNDNDENFYRMHNENYVDENLIQVKASTAELKQRIAKFIERKREAANLTNVLDFCGRNLESNDDSCARVNAIVSRRKDSKSHLKVRRVVNIQGPQTSNNLETHKAGGTLNAVEERIANAEHYLQLNCPVPLNVYDRLKKIEERILELESLSPEYSQFWKHLPVSEHNSLNQTRTRKRKYSLTDIDKKLENLRKNIQSTHS